MSTNNARRLHAKNEKTRAMHAFSRLHYGLEANVSSLSGILRVVCLSVYNGTSKTEFNTIGDISNPILEPVRIENATYNHEPQARTACCVGSRFCATVKGLPDFL